MTDSDSMGGSERYTIELTDGEVSTVLLALTVYANQNDEPTDGTTRQLGQMIAQTVEEE